MTCTHHLQAGSGRQDGGTPHERWGQLETTKTSYFEMDICIRFPLQSPPHVCSLVLFAAGSVERRWLPVGAPGQTRRALCTWHVILRAPMTQKSKDARDKTTDGAFPRPPPHRTIAVTASLTERNAGGSNGFPRLPRCPSLGSMWQDSGNIPPSNPSTRPVWPRSHSGARRCNLRCG